MLRWRVASSQFSWVSIASARMSLRQLAALRIEVTSPSDLDRDRVLKTKAFNVSMLGQPTSLKRWLRCWLPQAALVKELIGL